MNKTNLRFEKEFAQLLRKGEIDSALKPGTNYQKNVFADCWDGKKLICKVEIIEVVTLRIYPDCIWIYGQEVPDDLAIDLVKVLGFKDVEAFRSYFTDLDHPKYKGNWIVFGPKSLSVYEQIYNQINCFIRRKMIYKRDRY